MKLTHWLLAAGLLTAGGAVLGFAVLPMLIPEAPHACPAHHPQPPSPIAASHRFALTDDDVKLDREKPAVALDAAGRALLAWASQTGPDEYTLFLARSGDGGLTLSEPTPFRKVPLARYTATMRGKERTMTTPCLPRLAAHGNAITLGWLEAKPGGRDTRFLTAVSRDGGLTFSEPTTVHGPEAARPNFTGLAIGSDGRAACLWLDNRHGAQQPFCSLVGDSGQVVSEKRVYAGESDKGVCPCCDLDVIRAKDGPTFAAFRNSRDGHRDMYVARSDGESLAFGEPVCVTEQHWTFDGCPHDGPSLAVVNDRLLVAWMDGVGGKRGVRLAASPLDKLAFEPRTLGPSVSEDQGHPRLATANGVLHAVWDQALPGSTPVDPAAHQHGPPSGTGRGIVYARSTDGGATFSTPRMLAPSEGVFQSHPFLTASPDGTVLAAWCELSEAGKSVVVARLSPSAAGQPSCCAVESAGCCESPGRGALLGK